MKVNRIRWDKIKIQFDILKMASAYIKAEQKIISEAEKGVDLTGFTHNDSKTIVFESTTVEEFAQEERMSEKDKLEKDGIEIKKQIENAIQNEDYESAEALTKLFNVLRDRWKRL